MPIEMNFFIYCCRSASYQITPRMINVMNGVDEGLYMLPNHLYDRKIPSLFPVCIVSRQYNV